MTGFREKVVDPLVRHFARKIDAALENKDMAARVEQLMQTGAEAQEKMKAAGDARSYTIALPGVGLVAASLTALALALTPIGPAGTFVTALLGAGALMPVILGSAALFAIGTGIYWHGINQAYEADRAGATLQGKINREIIATAHAHPAEAMKSKRFSEFLRESFNVAADQTEENYKDAVERARATVAYRAGF